MVTDKELLESHTQGGLSPSFEPDRAEPEGSTGITGGEADDGVSHSQHETGEGGRDSGLENAFDIDGDLNPDVFSRISHEKYKMFEQTGNVSNIEDAIFFAREALSISPIGSNYRLTSLNNLALGLQSRYERFGDVNDIDESVNLHRETLSLLPVGHKYHSDTLNNLASAIQERYERLGDVNDINEVITLYREVLPLRHEGHDNRPSELTYLANAIRARFKRLGDISDVDEAISLYHEALSLRPVGHDDRSRILNNLAVAVRARHERFDDVNDIDESIVLHREALSLRPVGRSDRPELLNSLANAIRTRYERFGDANDIDEAITLHWEALSLRPEGHSGRPVSLNNLANTIQVRYGRFRDVDDIEVAIALHQEALSLWPVGHNHYSTSLSSLATAIQDRYESSGNVNDIDEAITLHREALSLRPVGHNDRSISLSNLASTINIKYTRHGDVDSINEVVTLHREALSLFPVGHSNRSIALSNLANTVQIRYRRFGDVSDIEEAITLHRKALSLRPVGHSQRASSLNYLAVTIQARYKRLGDINDINEAIALDREGLSLRPVGHNDRSDALDNLANTIRMRYERLGDVNDIDDAIKLHREALSLLSVGHSDRPGSLNNLAGAIQVRYEQFRDVNDINESISLHREALSLRPVGYKDRPTLLNNLAVAIQHRYESFGGVGDIDEAITLHREALSFRPAGHNDRSDSLNNLAIMLSIRYERLGDVSNLKDAKLLLREVLDLRPPGHQARFAPLSLLSKLLVLGVIKGGSDNSSPLHAIDEAQSLVNEVITDPSAPVAFQLGFASYHGSVLAHGPDFCVSMHLQCIKLLQRLVVVGPNIWSQQVYLHQHKEVASKLAARALDVDSPETAAIVADGGRSLLLGTMQQYRSPVEELRQVNQELADELQSVGSELERLALLGEAKASIPKFATELDFMLNTQRNLREQWNSLLDQIHALPGFEHFLTTTPFSELQAAASDGPVIILNAYESRCDAILIFSSGSPEVIPFQDPVSLHSLAELHRDLDTSRSAGPAEERQTLLRVFRFLWEHIVARIVDCLISRGVEKGSRVWWCPTSIFTLLPIHAAGMYDEQTDCNFSDLYISSYTPTISELLRARRPQPTLVQPLALSNRLLFIGNSGRGSSLGELENVGAELTAIRKKVDDVTDITGGNANPSTVLKNIQQHRWAHFSCHGVVDREDPTKSHFVLEDQEQLHVKDILGVNLHGAELAFLSACHSAAPGLTLTDEGIHLSSAMMFAGFRSVVGTMWEIYDTEAPSVSRLFYKNLMKLGGRHTDAAEALHRTIKARCISDAKQGIFRPERWAMFIHIGA